MSMFSGFSIGGVDWFWPDLEDASDEATKAARMNSMGSRMLG